MPYNERYDFREPYYDDYYQQSRTQNYPSQNERYQPQVSSYYGYHETTTRRNEYEAITPVSLSTTTKVPIMETTKSVAKNINANLVKSLDKNQRKEKATGVSENSDAVKVTEKTTKKTMPKIDEFTTKAIKIEESTAKIIPKNEYTFYWKLDNFPKTFQNAKKNEIFSHIFNVKGLYIRIRAKLNLREDETFLLDVEHLAENTEKVEVEVSDGLIFHEIVEEKIFQFIFVILDQNNPNNIYVSPTFWNNENENFLIPNINLLKNFLKDNSLLIKLVITF